MFVCVHACAGVAFNLCFVCFVCSVRTPPSQVSVLSVHSDLPSTWTAPHTHSHADSPANTAPHTHARTHARSRDARTHARAHATATRTAVSDLPSKDTTLAPRGMRFPGENRSENRSVWFHTMQCTTIPSQALSCRPVGSLRSPQQRPRAPSARVRVRVLVRARLSGPRSASRTLSGSVLSIHSDLPSKDPVLDSVGGVRMGEAIAALRLFYAQAPGRVRSRRSRQSQSRGLRDSNATIAALRFFYA